MEAARLIAEQADLLHADAMRRTFLLFDTSAGSCAEPDCTEWTRRHDVAADASAMLWRPWSAPSGMRHPLTEAPGPTCSGGSPAAYHGDGESLEQVGAFPLAGGRFDGRVFWAVFDPAADTCRADRRGVSIGFTSNCTARVLAVYERNDGDWRAVTQRRVWMDAVSVVAPVNIEPSQAWIVTRGVNHRNVDANEPLWEVLRFDGEALRVEVVENWLDAMILDVHLDGALDILGSRPRRLCFRCSVTRRAVRLYRWTGGADGGRAARVPVRRVGLRRGGSPPATGPSRRRGPRRWAEAVAVVDDAARAGCRERGFSGATRA